MRLTLLGTGTSHGIPCIACDCPVCRSSDSRDNRLRCSAYASHRTADGGEAHILIDIGPEFRVQALKYGITAVDCVLLTHSHADHLHGLDDIRIFGHTTSSDERRGTDESDCRAPAGSEPPADQPELPQTETRGGGKPDAARRQIPLYANRQTIRDVRSRFSYIFKRTQTGGGKPSLSLQNCARLAEKNPPDTGGIRVRPVPMLHGTVRTTGWLLSVPGTDGRMHSIAYLTDCNAISGRTLRELRGEADVLEHLVIDGLREKPHSTHFSYLEALAAAEALRPRHTWLTHICHTMSHVQISSYLRAHLAGFPALESIVRGGGSVEPAYDGLVLTAAEEAER
ncbi:MAG: MBL fold metallo-hydrolase [Treponemataceae bacterium]|nr:MBL fold metallo-hydrolase [Treponemataceae bacterium]